MFLQEFYKIEWSCYTYAQGFLKIFVRTLIYAFHHRWGIIYNIVYAFVLAENLCDKGFQYILLRKVANKVLSLFFIYYINIGATSRKFFCNAFSNPFGAACYYNYLFFECLLHN